MGVLWMIFQPLLFGLIAAEVKVNKLSAETVGKLNFHSVKFVSALEPYHWSSNIYKAEEEVLFISGC